jgi:chitin disaccharide deacetylase
MSQNAPRRHIWLCADDYGMAPGVNRGIRELIRLKRINATSVMVVGPAIDRTEIDSLKQELANNPDCALGLHATLTAPFHPLTMHFQPLDGGRFLSLGNTLQAAWLRRFDREMVHAELQAQIAVFKELFGRTPDYVDGHQHVQLFPQIRDAFITVVKDNAPQAWVRQCGRALPIKQRLGNPKALFLDILSESFRKSCSSAGVPYNPGFAGAYNMVRGGDFAVAMTGFLQGLPDRGLVMCHPGFVDETLLSLTDVTDQREREFGFLSGDDFPRLLSASNVTLSRS